MTSAYQSLLSFSLGKATLTASRGRDRRGSDSGSSGQTSSESIYEARPVSSRGISPCHSIEYFQENGPGTMSSGRGDGKMATITEQKFGILQSTDDMSMPGKPEDGSSTAERESIMSDPYDMDEADITYEDFMRYYGSPVAPLIPSVDPPPELPPIPQGATAMGRLVGPGVRPWRPPVSGYRTFGSMNSHPFHNAPLAEVMEGRRRSSVDGYSDNTPLLGTREEGRSFMERYGVWNLFSAVGCCFTCFGPRESIDD